MDETPTRKRLGTWTCIWLLCLALLAGAVIAGAVYQLREWRLNAHAAAVIAKLKEAGEPTTSEELVALYQLPPDVPDTTHLWQRGLEIMDSPEFRVDSMVLPNLGTGESIPAPGEPWPQQEESRRFLVKYAAIFDSFQQATSVQGAARFPCKSSDLLFLGSPWAQGGRKGQRLFELASRFHVYAGNSRACARSLCEAICFANCNRYEPTSLVQFWRAVENYAVLARIEQLLPEIEFTDGELAAIQAHLRQIDVDQGLRLGLTGRRADVIHIYRFRTDPDHADGQKFYEFNKTPQENLVICLAYMERFLQASRRPWPEAFTAAELIDQDWRAQAEANALDPDFYGSNALAFCHNLFRKSAELVALRNTADAALGVERYRLAEGKLPQSLDALILTYLSHVPIDPYDGQPLRYKVRDDGSAVVYSVGKDRRDNGGESDKDKRPDTAFRLPARAPAK